MYSLIVLSSIVLCLETVAGCRVLDHLASRLFFFLGYWLALGTAELVVSGVGGRQDGRPCTSCHTLYAML